MFIFELELQTFGCIHAVYSHRIMYMYLCMHTYACGYGCKRETFMHEAAWRLKSLITLGYLSVVSIFEKLALLQLKMAVH